MIWEHLQDELDALAADGLQRRRRILDSPCAPLSTVDSMEFLLEKVKATESNEEFLASMNS